MHRSDGAGDCADHALVRFGFRVNIGGGVAHQPVLKFVSSHSCTPRMLAVLTPIFTRPDAEGRQMSCTVEPISQSESTVRAPWRVDRPSSRGSRHQPRQTTWPMSLPADHVR